MPLLVVEPVDVACPPLNHGKSKSRQLGSIGFENIPLEQAAIFRQNQAASPLLKLPPELRNRIYKLLLTDWTIHIVTEEARDQQLPACKDNNTTTTTTTSTRVRKWRHLAHQHGSVHAALDEIEDRSKTSTACCGVIKPFWRTSRRIYVETRLMIFSGANRFLITNSAHADALAAALSLEQLAGMQRVVYATGDALEAALRSLCFPRPSRVYWLGDAIKRAEHRFWARSNKHIGEYYAFDWFIETYRRDMARLPMLCKAHGLPSSIEHGPLGPDEGVLPPVPELLSSTGPTAQADAPGNDDDDHAEEYNSEDQSVEMQDADDAVVVVGEDGAATAEASATAIVSLQRPVGVDVNHAQSYKEYVHRWLS